MSYAGEYDPNAEREAEKYKAGYRAGFEAGKSAAVRERASLDASLRSLATVPVVQRASRRIRLSRVKGWRKPEGAIVVARPTRWGNPWKVGDTIGPEYMAGITLTVTRELAVALHRAYVLQEWGADGIRDEIIPILGGHDLCCWCPLDQPCHCDTLLELANPRPNITITMNAAAAVGGLFGGTFPPGGGLAGASMVNAMSAHDTEIRQALAIRQQHRERNR